MKNLNKHFSLKVICFFILISLISGCGQTSKEVSSNSVEKASKESTEFSITKNNVVFRANTLSARKDQDIQIAVSIPDIETYETYTVGMYKLHTVELVAKRLSGEASIYYNGIILRNGSMSLTSQFHSEKEYVFSYTKSETVSEVTLTIYRMPNLKDGEEIASHTFEIKIN